MQYPSYPLLYQRQAVPVVPIVVPESCCVTMTPNGYGAPYAYAGLDLITLTAIRDFPFLRDFFNRWM